MECLKVTLREAVDNVFLSNDNTLRIKILKSQGESGKIGIQKEYNSDVEVRIVGVGQFVGGGQTYNLSNEYSYIEVDMNSISDDVSSEIHITNMANIIQFDIQSPIYSVVDVNDLKYLSPRLFTLGLYDNSRYIEMEEVLNFNPELTYLSLKGDGLILDSRKLLSMSKLETIISESDEISGDINDLVTSNSISVITVLRSNLYGDLAMLPSGLKRIDSTNKGQYAGNFSWSHRDASDKRFDIWRIDLGTSLDAMLVDMAACQSNDAMEWGFRVYGSHTMEESVWRTAAQNLANYTQLPVYVNNESF